MADKKIEIPISTQRFKGQEEVWKKQARYKQRGMN